MDNEIDSNSRVVLCGQPLDRMQPGERDLIIFLDESLPSGWEIYSQPTLNDIEPDVVLFHPKRGVVVIEVKDWNLSLYSYRNDRFVIFANGDYHPKECPAQKIELYRRRLLDSFLTQGTVDLHDRNKSTNAWCSGIVYFHNASTSEAKKLFKYRTGKSKCLGRCDLDSRNLKAFVEQYDWNKEVFTEPQFEALKSFRQWLQPAKHGFGQGKIIKLTDEQAKHAEPRFGGRHLRIRGGAGVGKSLVLAHRAAKVNNPVSGPRPVLVLSYNITMSHYLRDLINNSHRPDWKTLTWSHFHAFAKKQATSAGLIVAKESRFYDDEGPKSEQERFNPELYLRRIIDNDNLADSYNRPLFRGIYVDEVQDFSPTWLTLLTQFLHPDGELVIFGDYRQNVYARTGGNDSPELEPCRFRGKWATIKQSSMRVPQRVCEFLDQFATDYPIGDVEDQPVSGQGELFGDEAPKMIWKNVNSVDEGLALLPQAIDLLGPEKPDDVVVLIPDHKTGLIAVQQLSKRYDHINHMFGASDEEKRTGKIRFWMGAGGLKMCTIHSFKGWELDNVIVVWPSQDHFSSKQTEEQYRTLFYTAISRTKRNIVVLNSASEFANLGWNWDSFDSQGEIQSLFD